jgi:hypothetical protein
MSDAFASLRNRTRRITWGRDFGVNPINVTINFFGALLHFVFAVLVDRHPGRVAPEEVLDGKPDVAVKSVRSMMRPESHSGIGAEGISPPRYG